MSLLNSEEVQILNTTIELIPEIVKIGIECGLSYWSEKDYASELGNDTTFSSIAIKDGTAIGFIVLKIISPDEGEILNFAVIEDFQRQGIGEKLFCNTTEKAAQSFYIKTIWLEVRESNIKAIGFYQKLSFTKVGIRKNFYTNPVENAVLMKFELNKMII